MVCRDNGVLSSHEECDVLVHIVTSMSLKNVVHLKILHRGLIVGFLLCEMVPIGKHRAREQIHGCMVAMGLYFGAVKMLDYLEVIIAQHYECPN
jgi:hypothetical protein